MPRIPRGETERGIYHIINRGNMRMQVFDDMEDYEYFLKLLEKASKREKVEVHTYCLMPNHFHLLLIPKESNSLSRLLETAAKYGMLSTLRSRGRSSKNI